MSTTSVFQVMLLLLIFVVAAEPNCHAGTGDGQCWPHEGSTPSSSVESAVSVRPQHGEISPARVTMVVVCGLFILVWGICIVVWGLDGSLAARLAVWGLLPEGFTVISASAVSALLRLKKGETPVVVLRGCVTDNDAKILADAVGEHGGRAGIRALELNHNPWSANGLTHVVELFLTARHPQLQLQELEISDSPHLGDAALEVLCPLMKPKASKLTDLKAAGCGFTAVGLRHFAKAASRGKLRTLDFSRNSFSGAGKVLAELCEAPVLEELCLEHCELKAGEVAALAEQLPYTSIHGLNVGGNNIGSEGLEILSEHLAESQVYELALEDNGITAGCLGLSALREAWFLRPLERLRLAGNPMQAEDAAAFFASLGRADGASDTTDSTATGEDAEEDECEEEEAHE